MLAYVFWHQPYPTVERSAYETALSGFHAELARVPSQGFQGSATYRISAVPWLDGAEGYEDWNLLESAAAMEPLNEAAVAPAMWDSHAAIAEQTDFGHGGLYRYLSGAADPLPLTRTWWLKRPRGIRYQQPLAAIAGSLEGPVSVWRKQMVLGPAPEFALLTSAKAEPVLEAGWDAFAVERKRLE